jgi:isocitrate/isopropylmalate dehydrogenase
MLLNHLAEKVGDAQCGAVATHVRNAYNRALRDGATTRDLGGSLGTDEFATAVIERLGLD